MNLTTFIILLILILIVIWMFSAIIKKIRSTVRKTFGGGAERTRGDAAKIMTDAGKDDAIPSWAVEDAAEELCKYGSGDNPISTQAQIRQNLRDQGVKVYEVPKEMAVPRGTSKEETIGIIKDYIAKLDARYYKSHNNLKKKDETLIDRCMSIYYFAVTECSTIEAQKAVEYLVDQWKADVEDGKIS